MNFVDVRHNFNWNRPVRRDTVGVVIHHTAGGEAGLIPTVQRTTNGYHYAIRPNGEILLMLTDNLVAHHTATNLDRLARTSFAGRISGSGAVNNNTIGIAFIGNFVSSPPTEVAITACVNLIRWLMSRYPNMGDVLIEGHGSLGATACPGTVPVDRIRTEVRNATVIANKPEPPETNEFDNVDTSTECGCSQPTYYRYLDDIPTWGKPVVEKLTKAGIINGEGDGVLNISHDLLRCIVIMDRMLERSSIQWN